jgi:cytoskeletal protein CcmA (bactofilin family)
VGSIPSSGTNSICTPMTTIGHSVSISGDVSSSEDLQIDGRVRGRVLVKESTLVIGTQAEIEAEIRGKRVRIHGTVKGNVAASERIELSPTAIVIGSLSADRVVMAEGARFQGRIDMDRRTIAAKVAQYKATAG